jgi:CO/xanthine dehydrogenase Mo-binding subunit
MINTVPPNGHFSESVIALADDGTYTLTIGTAEFGNGTSTVHTQIAATVLGTSPDRIVLRRSDTAHGGYDTGAFGSTGTVVAGLATERAARALLTKTIDLSVSYADLSPELSTAVSETVNCGGKHLPLAALHAAAAKAGVSLSASARTDGAQRSVSFNVQGFRVAVRPTTGEFRILKSVHGGDAGAVINPMQCRGQIEGGVAQALGAAMFEEVQIDAQGRVINPSFRNYHLPVFADIPRTEVLFADTADRLGPFGAKSMSESPYNPVGAALANAIRDATGRRFYRLPLKPDRLYDPSEQ